MNDIPRNIIHCPRSGLPLAKVEALCSHGWPLLSSLATNVGGILHPIYGFPLDKLINKLRVELQSAEQLAWCLEDKDAQELRLTISATMYALDCMWMPATDSALWRQFEPSLPSFVVCVASGSRFLHLASWFHYATSKRLSFPQYRVCKLNDNKEWQNFSSWLDECFLVKERWEQGKESIKSAEELRSKTEALLTVKAENIYKRIDFKKVWNWIEIQMKNSPSYPAGRREPFKAIFLSGDMHPEDWTMTDVEDFQQAVLETCDIGNEIMFFINSRTRHIRAIIRDFYSSFTLLSDARSDLLAGNENNERELAATKQFMEKFDSKLAVLSAPPPEPKRESFASLGLFLKAQAEWRILCKRFQSK